MAKDFEIRGADDIAELVKRINAHADRKAIRKELYSGLARSARKIRGPLIEVMPASLPSSGGLSALIQSSTKWRIAAKGGQYAGVTLWARNSHHDIRTLTGRRLRHPVWGNRDRWVNQTAGVEPQIFTSKFEEQRPAVLRDILAVMNEIARKVQGH